MVEAETDILYRAQNLSHCILHLLTCCWLEIASTYVFGLFISDRLHVMAVLPSPPGPAEAAVEGSAQEVSLWMLMQ